METPLSIEHAKHALAMFGVILATGTLCGFFAQKLRIPDVAVFLFVGILLGPQVAGIINIPPDSAMNQLILIFGSCYILFDGGATLRLKVLKEVWITVTAISTAGVLITALITAYAASNILGIPFAIALLLGSVIASTDPATLVPVFKQIHIRERVAQAVISESAFNDAMGAILTFTVLGFIMGQGEFAIGHALLDLAKQSFLGILSGAALGYLAALLIAHEKYNFLAEYAPVVTLMTVLGAYLGADGLHASGFMAVFVFGIILGNKEYFGFRMEKGESSKLDEYIFTTSFIMRMFIFLLLGSQVDFFLINRYLLGGIAIVAVFMFIARPLTVFLCALPDRRANWELKELLFMCWTRETGVIPGALAGLLVGMRVPGAQIIASITFIAILMTILLQATTTRWLAKKLDLLT